MRIWKPTPLRPPNTSVSASTFQATAKHIRMAAKTNGTMVGISTSRRICGGLRSNASLMVIRDLSTPRMPSATLRATYGADTSATARIGPMLERPNTISDITA